MLLFVLLSILVWFGAANAFKSPVVHLPYATYQGTRLAAGVDQYLGMRYAAPPLGNLRFRAPVNPPRCSAVQDATQFGPLCLGTGQSISAGLAEDCLFVNVFAPSNATERSKLPVWVYIQGGGYQSNANANYNGTGVIEQTGHGVVFVNFNYRVGALGFLASEEVRQNGNLNAGLLDQRFLLQWVQKYISKFGGDPRHVVIQGASAGAGSVAHHLTAYNGRNEHLFVGAIPESSFWPWQPYYQELEFQYSRFVNQTGCASAADSLACLRTVSLSTIAAADVSSPFPGATGAPEWYFLPVIDGDLIVDRMYTQFEQGRFVRVPVLVDNDTNEGTDFAPNATSAAQVQSFFKDQYPLLTQQQLNEIIKLYPLMKPLPQHAAWFPSAAAAYGEATFICPGNEIASAVAQYVSPGMSWDSRFNVQDPGLVAAGLGVSHTIDTGAIFGCANVGGCPASYYTTNAAIIPINMAYYTSFVRFLNPNTAKYVGAPEWEPWGRGFGQRLRIQTNDTGMEPIPRGQVQRCAFWKSISASTQI